MRAVKRRRATPWSTRSSPKSRTTSRRSRHPSAPCADGSAARAEQATTGSRVRFHGGNVRFMSKRDYYEVLGVARDGGDHELTHASHHCTLSHLPNQNTQ